MTSSEKYQLCLRLYNDIINGYSVIVYNGKEIYIKHLRDADYALFEHHKEIFRLEAIDSGLRTEEEHLQLLKDTGHWSQEEEDKYQHLTAEIKNLNKTSSQIFLESQRNIVNKRIQEKEKELEEVGKNRNLIQVTTAEKFAEDKLNTFIVNTCIYKDLNLTKKLYTSEQFGDLGLDTIKDLSRLYTNSLLAFTQKNLNRIACLGVFINPFMLSQGNPFYFFNKRICDLTSYQIMLCSYGNGCKNILEHTENNLPNYDDLDETLGWYEREREVIKNKYSNKPSAPNTSSSNTKSSKSERFEGFSVPQASQDELNAIGASKDAHPVNLIDAAEKLKKKLGKDKLDIKDMLELHK